MIYAEQIEKLASKKDRLVVISLSAGDFKKLQIEPKNSEIWYIFAQKLQKFDNFKELEKNINLLGMAEYFDYNFQNATIKSTISGYLLECNKNIYKLPEKMLSKILSYFEIEQSTEVVVTSKIKNDMLDQGEFLKGIVCGDIMIFDKLSGELLK